MTSKTQCWLQFSNPFHLRCFAKCNRSVGTKTFSLFIILTKESGIGSFKVRLLSAFRVFFHCLLFFFFFFF